MIKNDFRYIFKKIIIGLGIFIGIFYFKSCQVHAQNIEHIEYVEPFYNYTFDYDIDLDTYNHYFLKIKYSSTQVRYDLYYFNGTVNFECYWSSNCNVNGTIDTSLNRQIRAKRNESFSSKIYTKTYTISNGSYTTNTTNNTIFYETNFDSFNLATDTNNGVNVYTSNPVLLLINYDLSVNNNAFTISKDYYNNNNMYSPPVINSTINSLNPTPILSDDDTVLLGYNFTLDFDNFNTDNFVYKYKVGNSRTLILNSNDFELSIRNNDTLYVWVEDLESNVVDSETFTVSNIGNLYQGDYSIDFTYKDIAPSDTENSTGLSKIIDRVDINITYLPKTNILKYQYQYVNTNGSLDPLNWTQLNNNNSLNEYTFVAHDNGTLYARILDENDNVLYSSTFTVDSIGKIKLFNNNNNVGGLFSDLTNNIDYSGPIYSLILMPINFIQILYNGADSGVCNRYKIGTLFNNDIYFDCFDLSDYIGSDLYNLLDILSSSGVIYGIALFIKRKYNEFTNLNDNSNDIM